MSIFPSKKDGKNKKPSQEFSSVTVQIGGIFLATVGILWGLSLLTFSPADPVLLFPHSSPQLVSDNAVGIVGSTAAFSLLKMVGGGSFVVPLLLVGFGLTVLWSERLRVSLANAGRSHPVHQPGVSRSQARLFAMPSSSVREMGTGRFLRVSRIL